MSSRFLSCILGMMKVYILFVLYLNQPIKPLENKNKILQKLAAIYAKRLLPSILYLPLLNIALIIVLCELCALWKIRENCPCEEHCHSCGSKC